MIAIQIIMRVTWVVTMLSDLRDGLGVILPLAQNQVDFIENVRQKGKICPEVITDNEETQSKILKQPGLHWAIKKKEC